ncbi:MAG TPA: hypothetical protein VE995_05960, partial [Gaiellaceae bacterium]|nr:hypothetical protein [Gaiellaceae bacterium]
MAEKARIDRGLIASLRESSRPLRPEASLTGPSAPRPAPDGLPEPLRGVVASMLARIERIEQRLLRLERPLRGHEAESGHTLFVPSAAGWEVVERDGPPPQPGERIELAGAAYRAVRRRG